MPKGYSIINKRITDELIPWCIENKKNLKSIPRYTEDKNTHPLYNLVQVIKSNPDHITNENIILLNKHGMVWEKSLVYRKYELTVSIRRIKNELIPWCKETNLKIKQMPSSLPDGRISPLYKFMNRLRKKKDLLPDNIVALLDEYGIDWDSTWISIDDKCKKYLLDWHKENDLPLKKMKSSFQTEYSFMKSIKRHKDELLPETIKALDEAGMDWTIQKRKTNIDYVATTDSSTDDVTV